MITAENGSKRRGRFLASDKFSLTVVAGTALGGESAFLPGLLILSVQELLAETICFAVSRGVLHNCDMAMMKTK